jgi:hypothetical protein
MDFNFTCGFVSIIARKPHGFQTLLVDLYPLYPLFGFQALIVSLIPPFGRLIW